MFPRTLLIALGLVATAPAYAYQSGSILVVNESGGDMNVTLPEWRESTLVRAGERALIDAPLGTTTVRATYVQLGDRRLLETETVVVHPYGASVVVLQPDTQTRLAVTNDTNANASLFGDGRFLADMYPGETELVKLPVGSVHLQLVSDSGRTLGETDLRARPYADLKWTVDSPRTGSFVVDSDVAIPTTILVDGHVVAHVNANAQRTLELSVGWHRVQVVDPRDRRIEDEWIEVTPYGVARMNVDPDGRPPTFDGRHERPAAVATNDHDDVGSHCHTD